MKTRAIVTVAVLTFCIALAVVIGQRLSGEAMAVLLGVIAGVGASIPTSLIVVWLALRTTQPTTRTADMSPPTPPSNRSGPGPERFIVVPPPPQQSASYATIAATPRRSAPQAPYLQNQIGPRQFTVIGGATELEELPQEMLEDLAWSR